jgi:hypothetical protein
MESHRVEWSLDRLVACCSDRKNKEYEKAWREFIKRYKTYIYQVITYRCTSWRVSRLRRQMSDTVNDVVSEVFTILTRSLGQYKEVEDEKKFRLWLATICNRAAGRFIKREFFTDMADEDLEYFRNYIREIEFESRWELYENVVNQHPLPPLLCQRRSPCDRQCCQPLTRTDPKTKKRTQLREFLL